MKSRWFATLTILLGVGSPAVAQTPNPTAAQTEAARARRLCDDPWVTIALETVHGRVPGRVHCFVGLYNGGNWGSYDQLLRAVRAANYAFNAVRIDGAGPLSGRFALGIFSGGTLIGAGGSRIVAAGGGNIVAAGGGNIVAAGGGNIIHQVDQMLISPGGGKYTLQSGQPVRVIG